MTAIDRLLPIEIEDMIMEMMNSMTDINNSSMESLVKRKCLSMGMFERVCRKISGNREKTRRHGNAAVAML